MSKSSFPVRPLVAALLVLAASTLLAAPVPENWPKWRGPRGDNISQDPTFSDKWPAEAKTLWSAKVGIGYSSPVVVDGRLYIFTIADKKDTLFAFDAKTGKELYKQSYDSGWNQGYPGTRATPLIEGKIIYTFGGAGDLTARELATGKEIWRTNPLKQVAARPLQWGVASNLLLLGDLLYVQAGQGGPVALAIDKKTGEIVHKATVKSDAGYASPIAVEVQKKTQIIIFSGEKVHGFTPDLATELWSEPWKTQYAVNASTPIYRDGKLFVTSAYGQGSMMLDLSQPKAKKLWEAKDVQSRFQGAILDGDFLFVNSEGTIKCLQWPENKTVWSDKDSGNRLGMGGAMVRHGNFLVALTERGKLLLLETAGKESPKRRASYNDLVEGDQVWSSPVFYDGRVYVKGKEELVCVDVSGK